MTSVGMFKHKIIDYIRLVYLFIKDKRTREHFARYIRSNNKKDVDIIRFEVRELWKYWGFFPVQYYTHDFYSNSCLLKLDEMKAYMPSYYFYKIIYPYYDDIEKTTSMLENKIYMKRLFEGVGIPTPMTLFTKLNNVFLLNDNVSVVGETEINLSIEDCSAKRIFIKPVGGRGGKGIIIAEKIGSGYFFERNIIDYKFLLSLDGDYVVEEGIEQHAEILKVYEQSVNTLRAVTLRKKNGQVELLAVTLRMGINGRKIDNSSAGGRLIGIDLVSGGPLKSYATYEYGEERFTHHPDSGFLFSELNIPNWKNIKSGIIDSARKLENANLIGWDVAITNEGFLMIEANTLLGLDHTQSGVGGLRDHFIVGEPLLAICNSRRDEIFL
ncbi:sugar-transfer associated ATP-grasp domain-containing protein [Vibrio metoecus]